MRKVEIESIELYRMIIANLRYAYTRNNHLEPSSTFEYLKKLLPNLIEADKETGLHTAEQVCDEAISLELTTNFGNGHDDEFGNRRETLNFIEYLVDLIKANEGHLPYNIDQVTINVATEYKPRYQIYEELEDGTLKLLSDKVVSEASYQDALWDFIETTVGKNITEASYNKQRIERKDLDTHMCDYRYKVYTPIKKMFYIKHI